MFLYNLIKNAVSEWWKPESKCGNVFGIVLQGLDVKNLYSK